MNSQWPIQQLPTAPPEYDRSYLNHLVRAIEATLERARSPGNMEGQRLNLNNLPTSATGLRAGDLWNDNGVVRAAGGGDGIPVTDGDKGDIIVSGTGTVWTIDTDVVTYAKMQNISATDRLLGRDTAAAGNTEELTVGGGIEFTGTGGIQTSAFTGDVTKAAAGTALTIANDSVTYAKMQNISASDRLLGRDTAAAGDTEELTVGGGISFTGSGGITLDVVTDHGTYTPTTTDVTNIDSTAAAVFQYLRVGNTVNVSGRIGINPTAAAATASEIGISLPIASALTTATQCCGSGVSIISNTGAVSADSTNDRAMFSFLSNHTDNQSYYFNFTYLIV